VRALVRALVCPTTTTADRTARHTRATDNDAASFRRRDQVVAVAVAVAVGTADALLILRILGAQHRQRSVVAI
jgi:hypothetical protein